MFSKKEICAAGLFCDIAYYKLKDDDDDSDFVVVSSLVVLDDGDGGCGGGGIVCDVQPIITGRKSEEYLHDNIFHPYDNESLCSTEDDEQSDFGGF
ncbi:Hypothetical predicted protein [Octopus vulgaris]|uniref:Uncharacterized protein n=1 Tax=Octopus vulgaris TaxID=6645 RepID=A0AA36AIN7_OCTVU|nr:Hypothetical predicted protein [Octopus vulgaris]